MELEATSDLPCCVRASVWNWPCLSVAVRRGLGHSDRVGAASGRAGHIADNIRCQSLRYQGEFHMTLATVDTCVIHELPKITDRRGNLTFVEGGRHVPFDISRVFYLYDVPTAEGRGAHAHREQHQFLVCLAGSFDVEIDDGTERKLVHLNRPWK